MSCTRNALPIFCTSPVDLKQLRRPDRGGSPRKATPEISPRKTPLTSRTPLNNCKVPEFKTPISTPGSSLRQKWRSANALSDTKAKSADRCQDTPSGHSCSPSLSPKSLRSIHRSCNDISLNDSTGLNTSVPSTPLSPREEASNFIVGVRVRPFNARESKDTSIRNVISMEDDQVVVKCLSGTVHSFTYDHFFWSFNPAHPMYSDQQKVFSTMVQPIMNQLLEGYNACLLAYGQTGSGKSYSMMGIDPGASNDPTEASGVIPRFCHGLFQHLVSSESESRVEISYYEIYDEKIRDLLAGQGAAGEAPSLKVRDHPKLGPHVVNLAIHGVNSYQDVQGWLTVGNSQRVTAATGVNEKSSRSHSIFTLLLTRMKDGITCRSRVHLVDLAGSERVAQTCATGKQFKEGVSINKSLLSLGKVITFLAEKKKGRGAVPSYRESVLTWLLRESLGGNSKTAMLATISPNSSHMDETLSTLRYACQARSIVNRVHRNEDANEKVIRELRKEVAKLTAQLKTKKGSESGGKPEDEAEEHEIYELTEKLVEVENQLTQEQLPWNEKLKSAEEKKLVGLQYLRRCGITLQGAGEAPVNKTPCLVNLSADPVFSGTLLYNLPAGNAVVGSSSECQIILQGPRIGPQHCELESTETGLLLRPIEDCETFINGHRVTERTELKEGDRVVLSGIHFFRVQMPSQVSTVPSSPSSSVDFEFAWKEVEAKLRGDLEAQRSAHAQEMETVYTVLEAQADALEEERRANRALEVERDVLQARVEVQDAPAAPISPYKSTFLKDLDAILTPREESKEKSMPSMRKLLKEATSRCSKLRLSLVFRQEQMVGDAGLEPVVKMVDEQKQQSTILRTDQFVGFLEALRIIDCPVDVMQLIQDVHWQKETQPKSIKFHSIIGELSSHQDNKENENPAESVLQHLEGMMRHAEQLMALSKRDEAVQQQVEKALPHLNAFFSAVRSHDNEDNAKTVRFNIPS